MKCHICDTKTEYICESCDEAVCDNCTVSYTQFNQIDFTLCEDCNEGHAEARNYERDEEEKVKDKRQELREAKNAKQRAYYHSPKQKEKRKVAKEKREHEEYEARIKSLARISKIFGGMGM